MKQKCKKNSESANNDAITGYYSAYPIRSFFVMSYDAAHQPLVPFLTLNAMKMFYRLLLVFGLQCWPSATSANVDTQRNEDILPTSSCLQLKMLKHRRNHFLHFYYIQYCVFCQLHIIFSTIVFFNC